MPKNKGKGGKNRRRGKNEKDELKRELIEKDGDQQVYAQVQKMLGNARLSAFCFDGKVRMCLIRGKLRKKMWIGTGDIVLIGLREYQDAKGDVILKYTPEEARVLKAQGHLPDNAKLNELCDDQNEGDVEFVDDAEEGFDENSVSAQDRNYHLFNSHGESDSNEETEEESEEVESEMDEKTGKTCQQYSSTDDDESVEDEEPIELLLQRNEREKPGARGSRGKGKRGK